MRMYVCVCCVCLKEKYFPNGFICHAIIKSKQAKAKKKNFCYCFSVIK